MDEKMKRNKAQVTIFIILALILVVSIVLTFLLIRKPDTSLGDGKNPQAYIESCVNEAVEEAVEMLLESGGDLEPQGGLLHDGKEITFLCYNKEYYKPCVNQRPMLVEHMEEEITSYIKPRVSNCFQSLESQLESRYDIETGIMELETKLQKGNVVVNIKKDFKMTRGDNVQSFNVFETSLVSGIYDLSKVAMEISNQEAEYCNFDTLGFMIIYPKYDINKLRTGDSDTVYKVEDLTTNQEFKFAIRSCALPAGF